MDGIERIRTESLQLKQNIEHIDLEIAATEIEVFSTRGIKDKFMVFKKIFDQLSPDEQYDLLHLLIKKIVYFEDKDLGPDGKKSGKMRMEPWEVSKLSEKSFVERRTLNPISSSQHGKFSSYHDCH